MPPNSVYFSMCSESLRIAIDEQNMVEIDKCRAYKYDSVVSNHFTWCQKPWYCIYQEHQPLCIEFNKKWWRTSRKVENALELEPREECPVIDGKKTYIPIDYLSSAALILRAILNRI